MEIMLIPTKNFNLMVCQDVLDLAKIRYALSTNSFKKYMAVTIATNVSEKSVAAIKENQAELQGIDIVEDSIRKYIDDVSMGPILGYTGQASSDELEELRAKNPDYSNDAIVGKTGIEKYMETSLQGTDGEETVTVDNLGKVLKIDDSTRVEPVAGNDTYLTIDSSWQSAIYQILKQRVAGILLSKQPRHMISVFRMRPRLRYRFMTYIMHWCRTVLLISVNSVTQMLLIQKKIYMPNFSKNSNRFLIQ